METRKKNQGSDFYPDCLTISPSLGQRRGKQECFVCLRGVGPHGPGARRRKREQETWCRGLGDLQPLLDGGAESTRPSFRYWLQTTKLSQILSFSGHVLC